jgi:hypothetical protein
MKRLTGKKVILCFLFAVLVNGAAWADLIDFISIGYNTDGFVGSISVGGLIRDKDLAIQGEGRIITGNDLFMAAGVEADYFFYDFFGAGAGGGIISDFKSLDGYARISGILHLYTTLKLNMDLDYYFKRNKVSFGILVGVNFPVNPLFQERWAERQHSTTFTDKKLIGTWEAIDIDDDEYKVTIDFSGGTATYTIDDHGKKTVVIGDYSSRGKNIIILEYNGGRNTATYSLNADATELTLMFYADNGFLLGRTESPTIVYTKK